jgi:hypothetical protein
MRLGFIVSATFLLQTFRLPLLCAVKKRIERSHARPRTMSGVPRGDWEPKICRKMFRQCSGEACMASA